MTKLLFDPIYTNDPKFCSMCFKLQQAARYLVERRDDVFITFLLPAGVGGRDDWEIDRDWLFRHPQVQYETVETLSDRMKEYYRFSDELRAKLLFNGPHWDTDIVVTARVPQVPAMKVNATGTRANRPWSRRVVTVEDMPILNFKRCVAQVQPDIQDLQSIAGYVAADANFFFSFWEKDAMLRVARQWLSPSRVQALAAKSFDASPITVDGLSFKSDEAIRATASAEKAFTVGYTQRFEVIHRRSADVMKLFERQWVFRGGRHKMRFVSTSNSKIGGARDVDTDFIEFLRPPREEFWRMMREEVDVVVVMSVDDAYPLSLIEPLLQGTPAVVLDVPYARATLGADYPFLVVGETEAYGMVKAFFDDYAGMYDRFRAWSRANFLPLMRSRNEAWFPPRLLGHVEDFERLARQRMSERRAEDENRIIRMLLESDEFILWDRLRRLKAEKRLGHLGNAARDETATAASNAFAPNWNEFRLQMIHRHGYRDAGHEPGHLRRN